MDETDLKRFMRLEEEIARLREQVEHLSQYSKCSQDQHDGILHGGAAICQMCANQKAGENDLLRERLHNAETFLAREGYRRCDVAACNCESWHDHRRHMKLEEQDAEIARLREQLGETERQLAKAVKVIDAKYEQLAVANARVAVLREGMEDVWHTKPERYDLANDEPLKTHCAAILGVRCTLDEADDRVPTAMAAVCDAAKIWRPEGNEWEDRLGDAVKELRAARAEGGGA